MPVLVNYLELIIKAALSVLAYNLLLNIIVFSAVVIYALLQQSHIIGVDI